MNSKIGYRTCQRTFHKIANAEVIRHKKILKKTSEETVSLHSSTIAHQWLQSSKRKIRL